jgi:hemin uptake protein HemP
LQQTKFGLGGVLTKEEDAIMITWTLVMGECGLSISLQQLKMKVVELRLHHSGTEYLARIGGTGSLILNMQKDWRSAEHGANTQLLQLFL